MTTIVKITNLEPESLRELQAESSREGFRFIERLCREWISGASRFEGPGEALFVAMIEGRVVGVCGLNRDPYTNESHVGRVRRLYVARACRRQGVGQALLKAVVAHARGHFTLLRARTEAAMAFFEAQGFRRVGGDHDWNTILSRWHLLQYDLRIAGGLRIFAWLGILASCAWVAWRAWRQWQRAGSIVAGTPDSSRAASFRL